MQRHDTPVAASGFAVNVKQEPAPRGDEPPQQHVVAASGIALPLSGRQQGGGGMQLRSAQHTAPASDYGTHSVNNSDEQNNDQNSVTDESRDLGGIAAPGVRGAPQSTFNIWTIARVIYCMITFAAMFVLVRMWGQIMPSHSYFYSFSYGLGFIPVFGILLIYSRCHLKTRKSALDAPWPMLKQSAFIGLMFCINYWGISTSAPHVGGPTQVIAAQIPLVIAAIMSAIVFKRRYPLIAWLGVFLTFGGTLLAGIVTDHSQGTSSLGWFLIFALGNLPMAVFAVCFEGFFKALGPDGRTATMELRMIWVNIFIVIWLVIFIPLFGILNQPPLGSFFENFAVAARCVFTGAGGYKEDKCDMAGPILLATVPLAALQSHSQALLSKEDTGLFASLALTIAPFLCDAVYPIHAVMGQYTESVSKWGGIAAAFCVVGTVMYTYGESTRKGRNVQGEVDGSKVIAWFTDANVPRVLQPFLGQGTGGTSYDYLREQEQQADLLVDRIVADHQREALDQQRQ